MTIQAQYNKVGIVLHGIEFAESGRAK